VQPLKRGRRLEGAALYDVCCVPERLVRWPVFMGRAPEGIGHLQPQVEIELSRTNLDMPARPLTPETGL